MQKNYFMKNVLAAMMLLAGTSTIVSCQGLVDAVFPNDSTQTKKPTTPVAVTDVTLDQTKLIIAVGETAQLNVTVTPANATGADVDWDSSDLSVATVSGAGLVKGEALGTATITAKAGGKTATCTVTVVDASMLNTPLTFEAKEAGAKVALAKEGDVTFEQFYVKEGDGEWKKYTIGDAITLANTGDKVSFWSNNKQLSDNTSASVLGNFLHFTASAKCYVYGNVMSLIDDQTGSTPDAPNFSSDKDIDASYALIFLFRFNPNILSHATNKLMLPATTLADNCYTGMFRGCTSLAAVPELPAKTLAAACYYEMFYDCTSLTVAPELPATTLAEGCYFDMFYGCTSLTAAPELPVTTLAEDCYFEMFYGCTSLTAAPELPATTLADFCYFGMFQGCTSLTVAPELPATTLASYCYSSMFEGCTSLTSAPALPAITLASYCYSSMFWGCTSLTSAPVLPATTLTPSCYRSMFELCTSLNSVTCLATDISADYCTDKWLNIVAASGTFTKAEGSSWPAGTSGIPSGWTTLNAQ